MPRTVFDVPALNARQQDLEQLAAQPDFWNDQQNAQKQMRRLDEVKAQLQQLADWRSAIDDAKATLELYELEADEDMLGEAQQGLTELRQGLDRWELERLLSGEYDKEGAVLSINAGAGGTDAQDWAQMLLRMYTRWAEDHDMRVTIDEIRREKKQELKAPPSKWRAATPMATSATKRAPIDWSEFHPSTPTTNAKPASPALK